MNEETKTTLRAVCIGLLVGVACYFALNSCGPATDDNDVDRTIQQIERNNERAGADIGSARNEVESAESELDGAAKNLAGAEQSVDRIEESVRDNQNQIAESRDLVSRGRELITEERGIFEDIDRANQLTKETEEAESD